MNITNIIKEELKLTYEELTKNEYDYACSILENSIFKINETNFRFYEIDNVISEAEYQGRKVTLGKITRGDVKKFKVYVKNDKGNIVKVNFGDPNMSIKKHIPKRRKSFRARHKCDTPGPRWKPRYWACKTW